MTLTKLISLLEKLSADSSLTEAVRVELEEAVKFLHLLINALRR